MLTISGFWKWWERTIDKMAEVRDSNYYDERFLSSIPKVVYENKYAI